ncbi:DUF4214 domain-containing protein [Mesobacterium sp. TK19101]|uniref:DUF4214 domain-containing protein n=1 Tax=Mesobacterium hydrothermale TaxID=3111907 RepID=A0ABU6HLD4_9RHOB|nr:DUF4214 domain-containing protein [Mesobacterium sp. TK19101]MEC3863263.1 DUF4214 domain-containing protein [Mesobacterium sp. TK19101]
MSSYRFSGPDNSVTGNTNQQTGTAVAAGDIDGDGRTDFIFGSSVDRGFGLGTSLYIISGASLALADAADGTTDFSIDLDSAVGVFGVYRIDNLGDQTDFGSSLAIGDFDGDNKVDLIVGANGTDIGGTNFGAAYLYLGKDIEGLDADDGSIDHVIDATNASYTFLGDESNGLLGWQVGALDVDFSATGTGDEILLTAPFTDTGADVNEGSVWIVSSDDLARLDALDGTTDRQIFLTDTAARPSPIDGTTLINGDASGQKMGTGIADVGPVFSTASNMHQLLIGGSGDAGGAGIVYLVPSVALGVADLADGLVDGILQGEFLDTAGGGYVFYGVGTPKEENIGLGLGTAGDVDGDGLNDLLIGGTVSDVGASNGGIAYLIRSAGLTTLDGIDGQDFRINLADLAGQTEGGVPAAYRLIGDIANGRLGTAVGSAGDVDGDGNDDFFVSAPSNGIGRVYLVTSAALAGADAADGAVDGDILISNVVGRAGSYAILGSGARSEIGTSLTALGDVDGDSVGDFFFGDPLLDTGSFQNVGGGHLVSGAELALMDSQDGTQDGVLSLDFILDHQTGGDFSGSDRGELLNGRDGDDRIRGLGGNDTLRGFGGNDMIEGGAGNDDLHDGAGNDLIRGGADNDTWYMSTGQDTFEGGDGVDTVVTDLRGFTPRSFVLDVDFEAGDSGARGNPNNRDSYDSVENLQVLGDMNTFATGSAADNELVTDDGADTLDGNGGNDTLSGGADNDKIYGDGFQATYAPTVAAQVYRLYQSTLDRTPDRAGHLDWTMRISSGDIDLPGAANGFVGSPEFVTTYGALNNTEFVQLLYQNVLNRAADAGGLANWVDQLDGGATRAQVVLGFSESPEFITNTSVEAANFTLARNPASWSDEMFRAYHATLDRDPDLGGFSGWIEQLANGTPLVNVITGFVNSTEFQNTYGALSNTQFVELLYQNVLNRAADAGGLADWVGQLDGGTSRAQVVLGFSESPEFIANSAAPLATWMRATAQDDVLIAGPGDDNLGGGAFADTFSFYERHDGANLVYDLEAWDRLQFTGFGYADGAAARTHMTQSGDDVLFSDQGVDVIVRDILLADITDAMIWV